MQRLEDTLQQARLSCFLTLMQLLFQGVKISGAQGPGSTQGSSGAWEHTGEQGLLLQNVCKSFIKVQIKTMLTASISVIIY